jgi:hypothetical protein
VPPDWARGSLKDVYKRQVAFHLVRNSRWSESDSGFGPFDTAHHETAVISGTLDHSYHTHDSESFAIAQYRSRLRVRDSLSRDV